MDWLFKAWIIGYILGALTIIIVSAIQDNPYWHDKEQKIVKYDSSLYKLVPVKYIEDKEKE